MLVVLRLSLGCHFLYEGVWKIKNAREFTAEPFLSQAKGPAAPIFYAMLPDYDGKQRLRVDEVKGKKIVTGDVYLTAWAELQQRASRRYKFDEDQVARAEQIYARYEQALKSYFAEHLDAIVAYFKSLEAFQDERLSGGNNAAYYKKRTWDRKEELQREVRAWLNDLDKLGVQFQRDLWNILDEQQQAKGWIGNSWNPLHWSRVEQINFAVTYGLTAIGFCLLIGLCTRLAALGGAAFMVFVVLTQPSWPTIYPPAPPVVGHALLINKDFIEMVALFLVASTAVGRWGGLDYFLYHWIGRPIEYWLAERA